MLNPHDTRQFARIRKVLAIACDLNINVHERDTSLRKLRTLMDDAGIDFSDFDVEVGDNDHISDRLRELEWKITALNGDVEKAKASQQEMCRERDEFLNLWCMEAERARYFEGKLVEKETESELLSAQLRDLQEKFDASREYPQEITQCTASSDNSATEDGSIIPPEVAACASVTGIYFVPIGQCVVEASASLGKSWKGIVAYHLDVPVAKFSAWLAAEYLPAEMAARLSNIIKNKPASASRKPWTHAELMKLKDVLNTGASNLEAARVMTEYCSRPIYETSIANRRRMLFRDEGWQPSTGSQ